MLSGYSGPLRFAFAWHEYVFIVPLLLESTLYEEGGTCLLLTCLQHHQPLDSSHSEYITLVCALEELRVQALKQAEHHIQAQRAGTGGISEKRSREEGWARVTFLLKAAK